MAVTGRRRAAQALDAWFAATPELDVARPAQGSWSTLLVGEHKRTIPVSLRLRGDVLAIESFLCAGPDEDQAGVYALLLGRHHATYVFRFALSSTGDIVVLGVVPAACVTVAEVDRLLGQLLTVVDDAFDVVLRRGFATYVEHEQRWRERNAMPRNPIS